MLVMSFEPDGPYVGVLSLDGHIARLAIWHCSANICVAFMIAHKIGCRNTIADDNAFVVVSEPDVRLRWLNGDGRERVQVEALGLSCFNPARGCGAAKHKAADHRHDGCYEL